MSQNTSHAVVAQRIEPRDSLVPQIAELIGRAILAAGPEIAA